jgi:hypothetical protein
MVFQQLKIEKYWYGRKGKFSENAYYHGIFISVYDYVINGLLMAAA